MRGPGEIPEVGYRGQLKVGIKGDGLRELIPGSIILTIPGAKKALHGIEAGAFFNWRKCGWLSQRV